MLSQTFSIRPTGTDNTYRRSDYLRGAAICFAAAVVLGSIGAFASNKGSTPLLYIFFGVWLLAMLSIAAALIFLAQAIIGSPEPVSFAVAPEFVPVKSRDPIRGILIRFWNPQHRASSDLRAYDAYLSVAYDLASRNYSPEAITSALEEIEKSDSLEPGADPEARVATANELLSLFHKN